MKKILKICLQILLFVFLTMLTQIGGLVYLLSLIISKKWFRNRSFANMLVFLFLYMFTTFAVVPTIAPFFGREKVRHTNNIRPSSYFTILLNRNYIRPKLNNLLLSTAKELAKTNIEIRYLDANFPFINKFPLLPHLSHNDGKKIDISLIYESKIGEITNSQKSMSGYGVFEKPKKNEYNQIERCFKKGYFQYDFSKYLTFGKINQNLIFSENATKQLINAILKNKDLGKLFIEPHLKERLHLKNQKIRFHGCRAVRHDDHIHIQLK